MKALRVKMERLLGGMPSGTRQGSLEWTWQVRIHLNICIDFMSAYNTSYIHYVRIYIARVNADFDYVQPQPTDTLLTETISELLL